VVIVVVVSSRVNPFVSRLAPRLDEGVAGRRVSPLAAEARPPRGALVAILVVSSSGRSSS